MLKIVLRNCEKMAPKNESDRPGPEEMLATRRKEKGNTEKEKILRRETE